MDDTRVREKARQALTSANLLHDSGDADGAANRAYYAMFDAAIAALSWIGADLGEKSSEDP